MLAPTDTARIVAALATVRGVDLRDYRPQSLARGIAARLAATGAADPVGYATRVASDVDEANRLLEAIVVPATAFFRDDAVFEALRRVVIPAVARAQPDLVRAWAIGVATGEEAWSIAMLLAEACEVVGRRWEVFATDLEPWAIARAERGEYDIASVGAVPSELRARFMDGGRVGPALRAHVHFEAHDVLGSRLAPSRSVVAAFQLVCLRNVLIYFDRRLQEKALERVASTLEGDGVLVLGPVETLPIALETRLRPYPGIDSGAPRLLPEAVMRRFRIASWPLWMKMLLLLVLAGSLPVAAASWLAVTRAHATLVRATHETLASRADGLAATLDAFHRTYLNDVGQLSRAPSIQRACDGTESDPARVKAILQAFARSPGVAYVALAAADGTLASSSVEVPPGTDVSFRTYFKTAIAGATAVSDVFVPLPIVDAAPLIGYSAPVLDPAGAVRCVAIVTVRMTDFGEAVRKANGFAGEGSFAVVLDHHGIRIAHSFRDDFLLHPAGRLDPSELAAMDGERHFVGPTRERLEQPILVPEQFAAARAPALDGHERVVRYFSKANQHWNLSTARRLSTVSWTLFVLAPESTVQAPVTATVRDILLSSAALIAVSLAFGLLLTRHILGPITLLRAAADRLGVGELGARVAEGPDEIGALGARFNAMAGAIADGRDQLEARVEQRTAELVAANRELGAQGLELTVQGHELRAQQSELMARGEEVARANRLKSEFLANMSHELRTPLNSIIGFTDLLLDDGAVTLDTMQKERLGHVLSSGRHLLGLINEILDLSKIEAGQISPAPESLDPTVVLDEAAALVRGAAHKRRVRVTLEGVARRRVFADPIRARQVLVNLLSNAVKFTAEGSTVTARAEDAGAFVRFTVTDHGPGIGAELMSRLFEPFVQGESALVKSHQGTGLGLAISKRLVEQHGGSIEVTSHPDQGAVFTFTLPAAVRARPSDPPLEPATPPAAATSAGAVWVVPRPSSADDVGEVIRATVGGAAATGVARGRVVVVDDDPKVGALLRGILEPAGFAVEVATTAIDGLVLLRAAPPAAAIIDLHLPDGSGLDVIRALACDPLTRAVPLLVLTSLDLSADDKRRLRDQVHAVMEKGDVMREELLVALERILQVGSPPALAAAPILVIDDHDLNRELARAMLERAGYAVVLARDGDEGLAVARRLAPGLILLDLGMPGKDGFAVARELRSDAATRDIPIVAVTAHAMRGDEQQVRTAGMDGYLTKPVDRTALLALVRQFVPGD